MQAWYPLSASVVATWFMTPLQGSRGDALAWVSLTGALYAGIVAGGAATLLARVGCRPGAWAVPIILFATSPRIGVMASSFSDADLAMAAALFGSLVFAVPRGTDEDARDVRADASYAGLLSGIALGVKVSAATGWFAARPSGTEDLYKIYAESFRGRDHLQQIEEEAQAIVGQAFKGLSQSFPAS